MKTKGILLSIMTSALVNIPTAFAGEAYGNGTGKVSQAKNVNFEFIPVKISEKESKNSLNFNGKFLLPITRKPALVFTNFSYQTYAEKRLGIKLILNQKAGRELEKLSQKYINTRIAVVHNGKVLMIPTVKSIIKDGQFEFTFKDQKKFEDVVDSIKQI